MNELRHIPTAAQRELDEQVEALRLKKLERDGHATEVEQQESLVPHSPDRILSLADCLPGAVEVFRNLEARKAVFFDEIRPQVEAAPQSIPCDQHPDTGRPINFDLTCQQTREFGDFRPTYGPCPQCTAEETADRQRRYWARRGVPERVNLATFANFETADVKNGNPSDSVRKQRALSAAKAWAARRTGFLLLIGTTGTGKGHLAASCLKSQGSGLWIEHVNLLADIRTSYTLHTTETVLAAWQDAEMFVLDEFGLSPGGKDEESILYQILADRYDKRRPTVITSNLERPKLREAIGFRLLDRIREDVTEISMCWPSHRIQ